MDKKITAQKELFKFWIKKRRSQEY